MAAGTRITKSILMVWGMRAFSRVGVRLVAAWSGRV